MRKFNLVLLSLPLFITSCGNKNNSFTITPPTTISSTTTGNTNTTNTIINSDYTQINGAGEYSFKVVDGHARAVYQPRCVTSFSFGAIGEIFENQFITGVQAYSLNNPSTNVTGPGSFVNFNSYDGVYVVYSEVCVLQTYINSNVIIDFVIDVNFMENGSSFKLTFEPEEHHLNFDGQCQCGGYSSDKIYNFNFSQLISISLEEGEEAFLIFDTPRDNFTLYFDTSLPTDDLSVSIDGFTEHGDYCIRDSLYMVVDHTDKKLEYNNSGVYIKYIVFTNSGYDGIVQNFTVSPC